MQRELVWCLGMVALVLSPSVSFAQNGKAGPWFGTMTEHEGTIEVGAWEPEVNALPVDETRVAVGDARLRGVLSTLTELRVLTSEGSDRVRIKSFSRRADAHDRVFIVMHTTALASSRPVSGTGFVTLPKGESGGGLMLSSPTYRPFVLDGFETFKTSLKRHVPPGSLKGLMRRHALLYPVPRGWLVVLVLGVGEEPGLAGVVVVDRKFRVQKRITPIAVTDGEKLEGSPYTIWRAVEEASGSTARDSDWVKRRYRKFIVSHTKPNGARQYMMLDVVSGQLSVMHNTP